MEESIFREKGVHVNGPAQAMPWPELLRMLSGPGETKVQTWPCLPAASRLAGRLVYEQGRVLVWAQRPRLSVPCPVRHRRERAGQGSRRRPSVS